MILSRLRPYFSWMTRVSKLSPFLTWKSEMYPSSLRMRAMPSLRREVGISAVSCNALLALRMRASMSATGSVSIASPARFRHAGNHALMCEGPQADPAQAELAEHCARASAAVAPRVVPHPELLRPLLLDPE